MTRKVLEAGLRVLGAAWPDYPLKAGTLDAYWLALHELHETAFRAAIADCLKTCTFFPKPAEILAKTEAILSAAGALLPVGELAWAEVLKAVWSYSVDNGWFVPVPGHDGLRLAGGPSPLPALAEQAVTAIGGMSRVCNCEQSDLGYLRREFLAVYDRLREQEIRYGPALGQPLPSGERTALAEAQA